MEIDSYEELGVIIFTVKGRIDGSGAEQMRQALQASTDAGKVKMVLAMNHVSYINSAGLRVLADIITQNKEKGGNLRLVGLNARVRRVFEIIGFLQFFPVYDNIIDAQDWPE